MLNVEDTFRRLLPIESYVPEVYAPWRPMVRDSIAYIFGHLAPERLLPKIAEQTQLPEGTPFEVRVIRLLSRMPSLQKLGQVIARNRNLDPALRRQLIRLEASVHDVEPAAIGAAIEREIGARLAACSAVVEDVPFAEGTVSAVVRFTWLDPETCRRRGGVFKVLKPYVASYLPEELDLLTGLATFLHENRDKYRLGNIDWRELFAGIRLQLEKEIDFRQEQQSLAEAAARFAACPGVRIPRVLPEFCSGTITAMTDEAGSKVTEAFRGSAAAREALAIRIVESLVAAPLFAASDDAVFHADPHGGNLFADESTGELLIFDWALATSIPFTERRAFILLIAALALRDVWLVAQLLGELSANAPSLSSTQFARVQEAVDRCLRAAPPLALPHSSSILHLLDETALAGLRFPTSLIMFRKAVFTLQGVLHDLAPSVQITPVVVRYAACRGMAVTCCPPRKTAAPGGFRLPIGAADWRLLSLGVLGFFARRARQHVACEPSGGAVSIVRRS